MSRSIRRSLLVSTLAAAVFVTGPAAANVVGPDTQNFNPTTSGLDFVTVESSETLKPGILNFGLFLNYAVNALPRLSQDGGASRADFKDTLTSMDVSVGLGLTKNWDIGFSIPSIVAQDLTDAGGIQRGYFDQKGISEYRVNTKYRVWGDDSRGIAIQGLINVNQIVDNPFSGQSPGPTLTLVVAGDTTINKFALGANVGYRKRDSGPAYTGQPVFVEPFKDQWIASVAGSYLVESIDTKIISEIFANFPAQSQQYGFAREASSAEWIIGAKHDITSSIAGHFGGGTEIYNGSNSPDWRLYAGLHWNLEPLWEAKESYASDAVPFPSAGTPNRFILKNVNFDYDQDEPREESLPVIAELGDYLRRHPDFKKITIEGHTDYVGTEEYNQDLSVRRANRVREILVKYHAIPTEKVAAIGYGESRPVADNGNFQGRLLNRRVEFEIIWP